MTSHLYSRPTKSRTQKVVLVLLAVIVVLIAALVFVWLKPANNGTPVPVTSATSAQTGSSPSISSSPAQSAGTVVPANGSVLWAIPVPGDGGPSTKSAAGVPRGYDASDSGATKAAINAVVAARWMKFRMDDPAEALGELAATDEATKAAVVKLLAPVESINVGTGKKEQEASPAGGKILGAHLARRDAQSAVVKVLWEQFNAPAAGEIAVSLEPIEVSLTWAGEDWLISGVARTSIDDSDPATGMVDEIGRVQDWVPVPAEGWYW